MRTRTAQVILDDKRTILHVSETTSRVGKFALLGSLLCSPVGAGLGALMLGVPAESEEAAALGAFLGSFVGLGAGIRYGRRYARRLVERAKARVAAIGEKLAARVAESSPRRPDAR
jgi:hypothetical protein